jgi:hypothetical protein
MPAVAEVPSIIEQPTLPRDCHARTLPFDRLAPPGSIGVEVGGKLQPERKWGRKLMVNSNGGMSVVDASHDNRAYSGQLPKTFVEFLKCCEPVYGADAASNQRSLNINIKLGTANFELPLYSRRGEEYGYLNSKEWRMIITNYFPEAENDHQLKGILYHKMTEIYHNAKNNIAEAQNPPKIQLQTSREDNRQESKLQLWLSKLFKRPRRVKPEAHGLQPATTERTQPISPRENLERVQNGEMLRYVDEDNFEVLVPKPILDQRTNLFNKKIDLGGQVGSWIRTVNNFNGEYNEFRIGLSLDIDQPVVATDIQSPRSGEVVHMNEPNPQMSFPASWAELSHYAKIITTGEAEDVVVNYPNEGSTFRFPLRREVGGVMQYVGKNLIWRELLGPRGINFDQDSTIVRLSDLEVERELRLLSQRLRREESRQTASDNIANRPTPRQGFAAVGV